LWERTLCVLLLWSGAYMIALLEMHAAMTPLRTMTD
jgi:hypothetical protein